MKPYNKLFLFIVSLAYLYSGTVYADTLSAQVWDQDSIFPQRLTAKDLMFACASSYMTSKGRLRKQYCSGFISGVEESVRLLKQLNMIEGQAICLPEGKTASQFTEVYTRYAAKKTTDLSSPAALVVIEAFQQAFPCPSVGGEK